MIYGHIVKKDGILYNPGENVPDETAQKVEIAPDETAQKPKRTSKKEG